MNLWVQTAVMGGVGLAITLGLAGWAMLLNRLGPRAIEPDLAKSQRQVRGVFREQQKDLREALASIGATDSIAQLDAYHEKHATLTKVLGSKFAPDDLNTDRYLAISDSVYAGLLSNFGRLVNMQEAIAQADPAAIGRIEEVQQNAGLLVAANEQALTALDSSIVELSMLDISTIDSFGQLEGVIARLEHLVAEAHKTSSRLNLAARSQREV